MVPGRDRGHAALLLALILVSLSIVTSSALVYTVQDTGHGGGDLGYGRIIGLVAVRNEEAMIDFCLRSLSLFTVRDLFPRKPKPPHPKPKHPETITP